MGFRVIAIRSSLATSRVYGFLRGSLLQLEAFQSIALQPQPLSIFCFGFSWIFHPKNHPAGVLPLGNLQTHGTVIRIDPPSFTSGPVQGWRLAQPLKLISSSTRLAQLPSESNLIASCGLRLRCGKSWKHRWRCLCVYIYIIV